MTTPTDPADVLTRLEKLHKAATPGPWSVGEERCDCGVGYPCSHPPYPYELIGPKRTDPSPNFPEYDDQVSEISQLTDADAAAIVAEHNATPALLAAVRGVLALADGLDSMSDPYSGRAADRLRSVVAAALGETGGGQ